MIKKNLYNRRLSFQSKHYNETRKTIDNLHFQFMFWYIVSIKCKIQCYLCTQIIEYYKCIKEQTTVHCSCFCKRWKVEVRKVKLHIRIAVPLQQSILTFQIIIHSWSTWTHWAHFLSRFKSCLNHKAEFLGYLFKFS